MFTNKVNISLFETQKKKKINQIAIHEILNYNLSNHYLHNNNNVRKNHVDSALC